MLREHTRFGINELTGEIDKRIEANAYKSKIYCAKYTAEAIRQAGFKLGNTTYAKNYGEKLEEAGFEEFLIYEHKEGDINHKRVKGEFLKDYTPRKGDVIVLQPYDSQKVGSTGIQAGHMAMFDGVEWISDFIQIDAWGGPGCRQYSPSYIIYRRDDW